MNSSNRLCGELAQPSPPPHNLQTLPERLKVAKTAQTRDLEDPDWGVRTLIGHRLGRYTLLSVIST